MWPVTAIKGIVSPSRRGAASRRDAVRSGWSCSDAAAVIVAAVVRRSLIASLRSTSSARSMPFICAMPAR